MMIIGPGIVGAYYGPDDANAVSKGDFGGLAVKSIDKRFPPSPAGEPADPDWRVLHGYSYHSYNKRGWRMLEDLEKLRTGMAVRCLLDSLKIHHERPAPTCSGGGSFSLQKLHANRQDNLQS